MCHRLYAEQQSKKLQLRLKLEGVDITTDKPYEVFPKGSVPTAVVVDGVRQFEPAYWGLVPSWVQDDQISIPGQPRTKNPKLPQPYNSRDDTIARNLAERRGMFYEAMRSGRAIIPVAAWGEQVWHDNPRRTEVYRVSIVDDDFIALAALTARRDGFPGLSCTVVTTQAEPWFEDINDRVPVPLFGDDIDRWLDPASDPKELLSLLRPLAQDLHVVERVA